MAGYKKLSKEIEERLIEQTEALYEAGYAIEDIAALLEQPVCRIKYWIGLHNQVIKMENLIHN